MAMLMGCFACFPESPEECKVGEREYYPRVCPWYDAATSGLKEIILVLDTSGSKEVALEP